MLNKQDNASIIKLRQILSSRYGKGLEIRQLIDMSGDVSGDDMTLKGTDLHVPIKVQDAVLGTAIIPNADDLSQENKRAVAQVVRMILEPTMYSWYLDRRESNLQLINTLNFSTENLSVLEPKEDELEEQFVDKPQLISNLLLLTGSNINTLKKVSLQIHEMTHRWAFVPFQDIASQLHNAQDFLKLGAMTLLIEDVEKLSADHQKLILEYISSPRAEDEPLLIATSKLAVSDLSASPLVQELVDELSVNCFDVERLPLSFAGIRDILELFFFKMKGDLPT